MPLILKAATFLKLPSNKDCLPNPYHSMVLALFFKLTSNLHSFTMSFLKPEQRIDENYIYSYQVRGRQPCFSWTSSSPANVFSTQLRINHLLLLLLSDFTTSLCPADTSALSLTRMRSHWSSHRLLWGCYLAARGAYHHLQDVPCTHSTSSLPYRLHCQPVSWLTDPLYSK